MGELSTKLFILYFSIVIMVVLTSTNIADEYGKVMKKRKEAKSAKNEFDGDNSGKPENGENSGKPGNKGNSGKQIPKLKMMF